MPGYGGSQGLVECPLGTTSRRLLIISAAPNSPSISHDRCDGKIPDQRIESEKVKDY